MSALSDFIGGAPKDWVSGTAYSNGAVVRSPADYNYYTRKGAGGGTTDPSADTANWQPTGGFGVKSIQRGTIVITNTVSATATLSPAVNPAKTELRYLGNSNAAADPSGFPYLYLTNGSTVTASKLNSNNTGTTVSFEITERY
jgi:hypothetical protein